jgi:hypothetical protein
MRPARSILALIVLLCVPAGCGSLIVTQRSVDSLSGQRGFDWQTHAIDGYVVYYEAGSVASRDLDAIEADATAARETVLDYVGETAYEPVVSIFVVDTRDRMEDLIGRRSNATAYYTSNSICLIWADTWRVGVTHELFHVVAMNLWGDPERWINEGMAVDVAGPWLGHDPHAVCKVLRSRGELPSLADLSRRFNRMSSMISYPAAGSFARYVREHHGMGALREIWDGGRKAIPTATGSSLDDLEAAWLEVVEQADAEGIDYRKPRPAPH